MALPKEERYTYADYLGWDENERIELIYGAPVMMTPSAQEQHMMMTPPSRRHQEVSGELYRQLANFLEGKKCRVYAAPLRCPPV